MSTPCTVIIGALELLDALKQSASFEGGEVLGFSENEPLKAIEAITARKPAVISLERLFAATSRGAALINRIKADPALSASEIRVVSVDGTYRVSPRRTPASPPSPVVAAPPPPSAPPASEPAPSEPALADITVEAVDMVEPAPPAQPAANLDYRGTRRAPRFRMAEGTEAQVEGALATVVDLSTYGAQILCPIPLKPQQKIRMVLADDLGMVRFAATVAWAFFEIPKGVSRYRAGIEFGKDTEPKAVDAFCKRHKLPRKPT